MGPGEAARVRIRARGGSSSIWPEERELEAEEHLERVLLRYASILKAERDKARGQRDKLAKAFSWARNH